MPAFTVHVSRFCVVMAVGLLSCGGLRQTPPNENKNFFQNARPDENTAIRFFYDPPGGDYFHVPLVFRSVKDGDSRSNTAPILEEGRTAFISFMEMAELLKGLANANLQWQESETVQPLGPYNRSLWEFQGFRLNYGCKVPGFKYGEYTDNH